MLDIGKLRTRMTIQSRSKEQDGAGGQLLEWTDVGQVWGMIEALTGSEREAAMAIHSEASHRVTVRYWPGLCAAHRFVVPTGMTNTLRFFNIVAVFDVEERHRVMECTAIEGMATG
jgi:SPP1 family predicted phage head-tail adaptor